MHFFSKDWKSFRARILKPVVIKIARLNSLRSLLSPWLLALVLTEFLFFKFDLFSINDDKDKLECASFAHTMAHTDSLWPYFVIYKTSCVTNTVILKGWLGIKYQRNLKRSDKRICGLLWDLTRINCVKRRLPCGTRDTRLSDLNSRSSQMSSWWSQIKVFFLHSRFDLLAIILTFELIAVSVWFISK